MESVAAEGDAAQEGAIDAGAVEDGTPGGGLSCDDNVSAGGAGVDSPVCFAQVEVEQLVMILVWSTVMVSVYTEVIYSISGSV